MNKKLAVVMDPIAQIHYHKDSTLALLWEAAARGYDLFYITPDNLYSVDGKAYASAAPLKVFKDEKNWYHLQPLQDIELACMDVILMRQDPPFNMRYIFVTYLLELAEKSGVLVVNKPQALRDANEKFFINEFPQYAPTTLVSANPDKLSAFLMQHQDIVLKPLDGMGGASVFRLTPRDPNVGVIIESMTQYGQRLVMAQRYLSEIRAGDKRILVIDGEPIDYVLARMAKEGETRANLASGGHGVGQPLSTHDRKLAQAIGKVLKQRGILLAGLDVIGEHVTEINITSPTCIRELDEAFSLNISGVLFDAIESILKDKV
ncbi:MAG: glutathione synthase [Gammaproteobacteria bacterium]|nr:glutathione synthase [Gammaproteobacteria bacterium]